MEESRDSSVSKMKHGEIFNVGWVSRTKTKNQDLYLVLRTATDDKPILKNSGQFNFNGNPGYILNNLLFRDVHPGESVGVCIIPENKIHKKKYKVIETTFDNLTDDYVNLISISYNIISICSSGLNIKIVAEVK